MTRARAWTYASLVPILTAALLYARAGAANDPIDPGSRQRFSNSIGMDFVYIGPGTFLMGSPEDDYNRNKDETQHRVTLTKGFFMQTTEVTQDQWQLIMDANPSKYAYCGGDCPVEMISWNDAQAFITKLNRKERTRHYRLPTEAEWEYACRAGTHTRFYFGNSLYASQANYNGNHPLPGDPRGRNVNRTLPVRSFPPNRLGLHDMHGNVYEWCSDWYADYPAGHTIDPAGPKTGISKVCRGGGLSSYARRCRSANRTKHLPSYWNFYIGLRLVCDDGPEGERSE